MTDDAITADHLAKRYRRGERLPYKSLRESLASALSLRRRPGHHHDEFWAIRDVSFRVPRGEVLGVIGRNGAGKSTLLKLLARITTPTLGSARIVGRVGSLLEVGTGFHPELTGRENVFLSGALLGMTRAEVAASFDEILHFAETEAFADTPVKHYSSGMQLRLAFAVAAHLRADVLLVDEVLAVGDAAFQSKYLGRLGHISQEGRTVILVSHQLNSIRSLSSRVLWLENGLLVGDGAPDDMITRYLAKDGRLSEWTRPEAGSAADNPYFIPLRLAVVDEDARPLDRTLGADSEVRVLIEGEALTTCPALTIGFALYNTQGDLLFWSLHTDVNPSAWPPIDRGINTLVARLPAHTLNEGDYRVELILSLHNTEWLSRPGFNAPAVGFSVRGHLSESPLWATARPGCLAPVLHFHRLEGTSRPRAPLEKH